MSDNLKKLIKNTIKKDPEFALSLDWADNYVDLDGRNVGTYFDVLLKEKEFNFLDQLKNKLSRKDFLDLAEFSVHKNIEEIVRSNHIDTFDYVTKNMKEIFNPSKIWNAFEKISTIEMADRCFEYIKKNEPQYKEILRAKSLAFIQKASKYNNEFDIFEYLENKKVELFDQETICTILEEKKSGYVQDIIVAKYIGKNIHKALKKDGILEAWLSSKMSKEQKIIYWENLNREEVKKIVYELCSRPKPNMQKTQKTCAYYYKKTDPEMAFKILDTIEITSPFFFNNFLLISRAPLMDKAIDKLKIEERVAMWLNIFPATKIENYKVGKNKDSLKEELAYCYLEDKKRGSSIQVDSSLHSEICIALNYFKINAFSDFPGLTKMNDDELFKVMNSSDFLDRRILHYIAVDKKKADLKIL